MNADAAKKPDIRGRSYEFARRIVALVRALPRDVATAVIARQLMRCGTSVGANVEEAQGGRTRRDFGCKMNIARKEAGEALYWLRLLRDTNTVPTERLGPLVVEADEIVRILVTIVRRTRASDGSPSERETAS